MARRAVVAGAMAVVIVAAVVVAVGMGDGGATSGVRSTRLDLDGPVVGDRSVVVGGHLATFGDHVVLRDLEDLELVASIDARGARTPIADAPLVVVSSSTALVAHATDGEELWTRDSGVAVAAGRSGDVVVSTCEVTTCALEAIDTDGATRWEARLEGADRAVAYAEGPLLTYPGERAVAALPPVVVGVVGPQDGGDGRDVVRVEPATGEVEVLLAGVDDVDLAVTHDAIAVLLDPDTADCRLLVLGHDGSRRAEVEGDCTDPSDAIDSAYLYADADRIVWVGADEIRVLAPGTGEVIAAEPVGDPAGTPTPLGVLRAGAEDDGWSLRRADGSDVFGEGWEWLHDATTEVAVVGREIEVGPFWNRSTVHEVAVIDAATGDVCGSQRVSATPFPEAVALTGCRAAVTSVDADGVASNWLVGG